MTSLRLLLAALIPLCLEASSCGKSTIPFSFEALPNGQPVLGCARPSCFGRNRDGSPISSDASFYKINRRPDGFVRKDANLDSYLPHTDTAAPHFAPQEAECEWSYQSEMCGNDDQWVGGIGPLVNPAGLPLGLRCCKYDALRLSVDRGVAVVAPGQIVIGGEVFKDRRQYAFDYISDILKHTLPNGTVTYDVSVRRMPCLPVPDELSANVGNEVSDEMFHRFDPKSYREKTRGTSVQTVVPQVAQGSARPRAFQAPSFVPNAGLGPQNFGGNGGGQAQIQGPFVSQNEQIQPQEEVILVQQVGTQPQYYPVQNYQSGGGGDDGGFFCFSGDTMIRTLARGQIRIDELNLDDWVMSSNRKELIYEPLKQWVHRSATQKAQFHKIELRDGNTLKLTAKHFIYKVPCEGNEDNLVEHPKLVEEPEYAETVVPGDCVYTLAFDDNNLFKATRVERVSVVEETGIYSPMTVGGDIVVNNVFASCHSVVKSHPIQETFFKLIDVVDHATRYLFLGQTTASKFIADTLDLPNGIGMAAEMYQLVMGGSQ